MRRTLALRVAIATSVLTAAVTTSGPVEAKKSLEDYRYFRALSVDLAGRVPTRADIAAFERDDFALEKWIDAQIAGKAYPERVRRTYMDLLRLDLSSVFTYRPNPSFLRRQTILGPDGKKMFVYYRNGQRRMREETDGVFCLSNAEIGVTFLATGAALGTLVNVDATVLAKNTKLVKPWWLYKDYRSPSPTQLYGAGWGGDDPTYTLQNELVKDADGTTNATWVRVCNEEAATADTGTVYASGRKAPPPGTPPPYERAVALPLDDSFALANNGKPIECDSGSAYSHSTTCGCGVGLERCLPGIANNTEPSAFMSPGHVPLGSDQPMDIVRSSIGGWTRFWWSQEAIQLIEYVAREDRDFREVLTGHYSLVNGPLTQFYKSGAGGTCCGAGINFGYVHPEALFDPEKLPDMLPHDAKTWKLVADRGANASGILTMPIFLSKYGTRRGRAHVLYNVFQCRDFVAGNVQLKPSTEPDLTKRDGCSTCHVTLEPMAAYFARVLESDWTWLPKTSFPINNATCKAGTTSGTCKSYYDAAFATSTTGMLRGAYASTAHADAGPAGLAKQIVESPEFASCVVTNVLGSFLGRQITVDDVPVVQALTDQLVKNGYKLKPLVSSIVRADVYRNANNLNPDAWRAEGGGK